MDGLIFGILRYLDTTLSCVIQSTIDNSNENRFPLDFLHTLTCTVILRTITQACS